MKILVVEDQTFNMRLLEQILLDICDNIEISKAMTGREALEKAEDSELDLILMDVGLPDISGVKVTRKLKEDNQFNTPIIAVTAYASKEERQNFREIFDGYISKPIDEDKLKEVIQGWVKI